MARSRGARYVAAVLVVAALGTLLVEWWLCDWPVPHSLSPKAAFFMAAIYVSTAVLSGAAMNRLLWFPPGVAPSVPLSLFTIASAIGWIWIPFVVLLSRQRSVAAVLLAALAAASHTLGQKSSPTTQGNCKSRLRHFRIRTHHPLAASREQESCRSPALKSFARRPQPEQANDHTLRRCLLVFPATG